jgi:hypothetical protein
VYLTLLPFFGGRVVAEVKRNEEGSKAGMGAEWKILAGRGGRSELPTGLGCGSSLREARGEVVANERERTREKACEPDNSRGEMARA